MRTASEIADDLATKASGITISQPESAAPPAPPPPPYTVRPSYFQPRPRPAGHPLNVGKGSTVHAGGHELRQKPLWPNETAMLDDARKAEPQREPQRLTQSDWDALAEIPVTRDMTFDSWVREACLQPFVDGYDPDYAAAARLYLARKRDCFSGKR